MRPADERLDERTASRGAQVLDISPEIHQQEQCGRTGDEKQDRNHGRDEVDAALGPIAPGDERQEEASSQNDRGPEKQDDRPDLEHARVPGIGRAAETASVGGLPAEMAMHRPTGCCGGP